MSNTNPATSTEPEAVPPEADSISHHRPKQSRERDKLQLSCNPCRRHRDVIVKTLARTVLLEDKSAHIPIIGFHWHFKASVCGCGPKDPRPTGAARTTGCVADGRLGE
ncbi:hypothetical protein VN97_g620 [Penicillium thymicola]|uniref:Uncharacterized protein n=1 Tax=Penicillium thymicola TaxID=293382 RepID=A0AAI9TTY1_PENTH|nr:hypothetical protein VN97_g620 [Penicillium thymicola]